MDELKPCPFCGKPFGYYEYPDDGTTYWTHNSPDCPMHRYDGGDGWLYLGLVGLAKEINTRPIEDALRAQVAALTAALKWYADEGNYDGYEAPYERLSDTDFHHLDSGERARRALGRE